MADAPEPSLDELLWSAAAARLVLPPEVHVQAPPNLSYDDFPRLLEAGIDDWGGISPVTIDHVNPEAPWPELERLGAATRAAGLELAPRLAVYPEYLGGQWVDPTVLPFALRRADGDGLAREDRWAAGAQAPIPFVPRDALPVDTRDELGEDELVRLFSARGAGGTARLRGRRRAFDARSAATTSPTSSPATSTTPTSATSAAASARSRRASSPRTCAASPTWCRSRRSPAGPRRRGLAAASRSASRAGSTRRSPATRTSRSARP